MLIEAVAQASAAAARPLHLTNLGSEVCRPLQSTKCSFSRTVPAPLNFPPRRLRLLFVPRAVDSTPPASASPASSGKFIVPEECFSLSKRGFVDAHLDDGLLEIFGLKQGWHASVVMVELITAKHIAQVVFSYFCIFKIVSGLPQE